MANFNVPYLLERDGQIEFFRTFGVPFEEDESVLVDNTDGVFNGCLFEFKLNISNLNRVLFQAIKYLSKMRIKGESVPATVLLVDLNATTVYAYQSADYKDEIHKVYTGASSKDVTGFTAKPFFAKYNYAEEACASAIRKIIKGKKNIAELYLPVDIDENCIVGWAERYYRELPKANKGDFLGDDNGTAVKVTGEIREPKHFRGLINPYTGKSNEKFKYLMDCLNDRLSKRDLGAFYTPMPYARKATELVQMAVERVPFGNDYIILDRCAGTGNLESALIGLYDKNGDELISHCVVSTYEYYEYKVLQERIGDKVREIIPPTEANVVYANGKVANADAMSEEYIKNPIIRQYVDNPKCTIILFENPPYQDSTAVTFNEENGTKAKANRTTSFVNSAYRKITSTLNEGKASAREISNLFIWSGFEYYLRQDTDSYILFSPVKYFKNVGLAKKECIKGYIFNRKYFHATDSAIGCILWSNVDDVTTEIFEFPAINIVDGNVVEETKIVIKKVHNTFINYYDKRTFPTDVDTTVWCGSDGVEMPYSKRIDTKSVYNDNIVCVLGAPAYNLDAMKRCLVRQQFYRHGLVFYVRLDNYLKKLPLWVAKMFPQENWYDRDIYNTTSDGGDAYTKDTDFLKTCLIYTCLSNQNKCLTFEGSDGRHYQNELCFDTGTLASKDLLEMRLDGEEQALLGLWYKILSEAKQTANYKPEWTYGVYQITKELNTFMVVGTGKNKKKKYDYPALNGDLDTLRTKLKDYYKSHIMEKMFKYELLK